MTVVTSGLASGSLSAAAAMLRARATKNNVSKRGFFMAFIANVQLRARFDAWLQHISRIRAQPGCILRRTECTVQDIRCSECRAMGSVLKFVHATSWP